MPRILLEDTWQFIPDRKNISESKVGRLTSMVIPGTLSKCDEKNGNGRRYRRPVWEANLKPGSRLRQLIEANAAFGTLEHPEDGNVDLRSPISHKVTHAELREDGTVVGAITIFDDLPEGHKLRVLIESGYNPLVSSRGYGSVVRGADGVDEVQEDYVCEGWDVVSNPSFVSAQLSPTRESAEPTALAAKEQPKATVVVESGTSPAAGKPQVTSAKIMDISQVRTQVSNLRAVDIFTAGPRSVTESFSQLSQLQRALHEARASTPALAFDCDTLIQELNGLSESWHGRMKSLQEESARLKADNAKLATVAENAVKLASSYKKQLTESARKHAQTVKLFEGVAKNGRGWQVIATKRASSLKAESQKLKVACEAVDKLARKFVLAESGRDKTTTVSKALRTLAEKYHRETTRLARRLVEHQFPADVAKPEHKKALAEARTAEQVLAVREKISPTPKPAAKPADKVQESQKPNKPGSEENPAPNAGVTPGIVAVQEAQIGHATTAEQAIGMVRRLSKAGQ